MPRPCALAPATLALSLQELLKTFTVQWSDLVHWLVSSAMSTQTRGTQDVIRCHMVLCFSAGESREQRSSVLKWNSTLKNSSLKRSGREMAFEDRWMAFEDRWIKNKHIGCACTAYAHMYGWMTPLGNRATQKGFPVCNPWQLSWSVTDRQTDR